MVDQEQANSNDVCTQAVMEEDHAPKIRKPYTITKQRERWSDEEHEKFLEALKLHGRAWRKIEEHVGTKTAVQIRSHAQKFFSKVIRDTNDSNASSTELIEIPPPRPKRKPSHPYPRKVVLVTKKEKPTDELASSISPSSSIYDQENQSPTSVLSPDTLALGDSTEHNRSPSPLSSSEAVDQVGHLSSEDKILHDDVNVSASEMNPLVSVKLELSPSIDSYDKQEYTKVLKLFGKDVVVLSEPSDSSSMCINKSPSSDMGEAVIQACPKNFQPMYVDIQNAEKSWDHRPLRYVDESGNQVEKPTPLPWWAFFRSMTIPSVERHVENVRESEIQREGSSAGSSSESVNAVGNTGNWDAESQLDKEDSNTEKTLALFEKRLNTSKARKGFVPYKRQFSERNSQSSTEDINEKECQKIRLCL